MKLVTNAWAMFVLVSVGVAHAVGVAQAEDFDFHWQSKQWTKTVETPTQTSVSGPFTRSGESTASFTQTPSGGINLRFDGSFGGSLAPSGDGTFNGPMIFPVAGDGTRSGLGVLTPSADGFTVVVNRAASGPDAGAAFVGQGSRVSSVAASEPATVALALAGLVAACVASRRRPR